MIRSSLRLSLLLTLAAPASANDRQVPKEESAAERLFREGQQLLAQGQIDLACAKFAASDQLEPGTGTLLWLADCQERQEHYASAWGSFRRAAARARLANDAREHVATTRAALLEKRLVRVPVEILPRLASAAISIDGAPLAPGSRQSPPLDKGMHVWQAKLADGRTYEAAFDVPAEGVVHAIVIGDGPLSTPSQGTTDEARTSSSYESMRWPLGLALASAGVGALGISGYLALDAKSEYDSSIGHCINGCDDIGYARRSDAHRTASAATWWTIAGGACAAGGLLVILWPKALPSVSVAPDHAQLQFKGEF